MTIVAFDGKFTVPDEVLFRALEGEAVLLNLQSEEYFGLDAVGVDMWDALTAATTIEEACTALLAMYDVEEARLRADLDEFIERLCTAGLATVRPANAAG